MRIDTKVAKSAWRLLGVALLLAGAGLLGGCEQSLAVKVESDVPDALVERLPVTVAVVYPPDFRNHIYAENSEDRPNWQVDTGSSQVAVFDRVLSSMFNTVPPAAGDTAPPGADGLITASLEEAQFATPEETKLDFYEAWFRYKVSIYQPDGQLVTDWFFSAYGKSAKAFMGSRGQGLNDAIGVALRDAGAKLTVGLPEVPEVKAWLRRAGT